MLKVLVIDDDPTTCNLLETILQMEAYETRAISKIGHGGIISVLNGEAPHILVLDFHLDGKEALEYVKDVRDDPLWKDLPILVTSAIDRRQAVLSAGANDFILKPFNWEEIIAAIQNIRDNQRRCERSN